MFNLLSWSSTWFWGLNMNVLGGFMVFFGSSFWSSNEAFYYEWNILEAGQVLYKVSLFVDGFSMIFGGVVLIISGSIFFYIKWYMSEEKHLDRFVFLVGLFVFSMILFLFSGSLIWAMVGWDGLGIISFALVIYYQNNKALSAGLLTVLTNRLGDVFLLLSIALCLPSAVWNMDTMGGSAILSVLVLLGAMTKSAQLPFCSWLPAAMEAPTPVSALVHSSTLVTAGIFLMIRFYSFLESSGVFGFLMILSSLTMMMASLAAFFSFDVKNIVALSTLSHLGLMGVSLGLGFPLFAYIHMVAHALMKAVLFLCVGVLIQDFQHTQDVRLMSGLGFYRPISGNVILISLLGLSGFPFLIGYYSKHTIMMALLCNSLEYWSVFLALLTFISTSMYSIRLLMMSFFSFVAGNVVVLESKEEKKEISFSLLILSFSAIIGSYLISSNLEPSFNSVVVENSNFVYYSMIFGVVAGYVCSNSNIKSNFKNYWLKLIKEWFLDFWFMKSFSGQFFLKRFGGLGRELYENLDRGWFESVGSKGFWSSFKHIYLFFHGKGQINFNLVDRLFYGFLMFFMVLILMCY